MKKLFYSLMMIAVLTVFAACDSNDDNDGGDPISQETCFTYKFSADNLTPIFEANISYINADGESIVEVIDVFPWEKKIDITRPFDAKLEVHYTLKTGAEIPDAITVAGNARIVPDDSNGVAISTSGNGEITFAKDKLTEYLERKRIYKAEGIFVKL